MSFNLLAGSHAGVEALGDDVGDAVIDGELDVDVRYRGRNFSTFGTTDATPMSLATESAVTA